MSRSGENTVASAATDFTKPNKFAESGYGSRECADKFPLFLTSSVLEEHHCKIKQIPINFKTGISRPALALF